MYYSSENIRTAKLIAEAAMTRSAFAPDHAQISEIRLKRSINLVYLLLPHRTGLTIDSVFFAQRDLTGLTETRK